jgi:alpha-L-fucosidase
MKRNYKPNFTYQEFAPDFTAELFNASAWVELFEKSGAKYVVLTSKHHEGFTMWPSTYSFSWNAMDVGPHRDIVSELATAVRKQTDLKFGLYYSLFEWFNRMWMADKASFFVKTGFSTNKVWPELTELIKLYQPDLLWSDGDAEAPDVYWRSQQFLAWLYNDSPVKDTIVTNDRWGYGVMCKHGGFLTCSDRYNPGTCAVKC